MENDLNQTSMIMCNMLIFQGVVLRLERPHGKLRRASIEGTQVEGEAGGLDELGRGANEPVLVQWGGFGVGHFVLVVGRLEGPV